MDHDAQAKPAPAKRSGGARRGDTRELGRVVRRYLGTLEASRSSRGQRRTIEGFSARLLKIDELLVSADPLARLHLTQERIDLHAELVRTTNGQEPDLSSIEKDFVRVAKQYGELAGITFAAWRQVGVDAEVLDQAGIVRTGPSRPDASRVRRTAEASPGADAEPLLPRTEPIAPVAEPELPLEAGDTAVPPALAPEAPPNPLPASARTSTISIPSPPPPPPAPAKAPKAEKQAASKAKAAEEAPPGDDETPKMRRKRIAG